LLKRYSGETDILVGSPFTNRDEIALEKLIGFFDDTLVLRSDLSNDLTFSELLEQVWTTTQALLLIKICRLKCL
jgi:non-ribosomal peptide synthetase component F